MGVNITELARRLRVPPDELKRKLPELGFSVGDRAIKVDNRIAAQIQIAWNEMQRRARLEARMAFQKGATGERKEVVKDKKVVLPSVVTVKDFAARLELPIAKVMQELMKAGILASLNENIDYDTAAILAGDLGYEATLEQEASKSPSAPSEEVARVEKELQESRTKGAERPPVVVVMGHVDHGKTKLLDTIRKTNVVATEAGGITQHIGAYQAEYKGRRMTFIDTPGHEAFTVMRSRGAKVADMAILVVAADDGIQPQTVEAIDIILAAKMPFVVALNKIDMPGANTQRVLTQLSERNLIPEDWGGKTIIVPVSAKQGTNIEKLLEMVLLASEMEKGSLVAEADRAAIATVIDSRIDKGEGPVASVLVQTGTLHIGDTIGIRGVLFGKVRAMKDWNNVSVTVAPPSMPVKVLGWKGLPAVGDILEVAEPSTLRKEKFHATREGSIAEVTAAAKPQEASGEKKLLPVIVKADVLGSLEALLGILERVQHPDVGVAVVGKGLGFITDTDVLNAEASKAVVYAFGVKANAAASALARDKHVEIFEHKIIYKIVEDILARLQTLLPQAYVVTDLGDMEVLANFRKLENGWIIGGRVKNGPLKPGGKIRIFRGEQIIGEGNVTAMQIGARAVKSVQAGEECGVSYTGKIKAEPGDRLEFYEETYQGRKLEIEGFQTR